MKNLKPEMKYLSPDYDPTLVKIEPQLGKVEQKLEKKKPKWFQNEPKEEKKKPKGDKIENIPDIQFPKVSNQYSSKKYTKIKLMEHTPIKRDRNKFFTNQSLMSHLETENKLAKSIDFDAMINPDTFRRRNSQHEQPEKVEQPHSTNGSNSLEVQDIENEKTNDDVVVSQKSIIYHIN